MVRGGSTSQKSNQQSQSTTTSGTKFNQDFLDSVYGYYGPDPSEKPENFPKYVKGAYTPGAFTTAAYTPVDGGDFNKIEQNVYGGQQSKLSQAYNTALARQREELSQSGALNSPAQYLEGGARSSMDRAFLDNLQQAARDASTATLGLKSQEAARRTGFDVGQAQQRTAFDVGEAGRQTAFTGTEAERETGFNERLSQQLYKAFLNKLMFALESGKFGTGQSTATGQSSGSGTQFGFFS